MIQMKDSGIEWLGDIPAHWKICRLKNLAQIKNGQDYRKFFDVNGKYPVIGSGGKFSHSTKFLYDKPSVLLGRKGTIDKPLFVDFPFWTVDTMYYTEIKNTVCQKFFFYLCCQIPYDFYQYGSAVPSMTQRDLNSVKFPLPPIEEQQKISAYLDKKCAAIDTAVDAAKKLVVKLGEYKKALITETVTKGLNRAAKMKDSGVEWLGEIPEHWKIIKLKYLATIKNGQDYKKFFDENGKYPVMGSGGEFAHATNFLYDKPSVLLGRKGTIDKPLFVDFPFWTVDTMYYTEIKNTVVPKFFFYLCLQIPYDYYQYGSALPSMTQHDLYSVKFPLPPLEKQKEMSAYLDKKCAAIDENIAKHQQLAEKLTEYKKSLIYEVVTGKMEV